VEELHTIANVLLGDASRYREVTLTREEHDKICITTSDFVVLLDASDLRKLLS
jgi:hypothetical protein